MKDMSHISFSFRGDHIVPNFEEIWPSSKSKEKTNETKSKVRMDH